MTEKRRIDVMVSSTSSDLEGQRARARDAILRVKWQPEMMEHDGAASENALERSLRYVDESDVYILILGFRYGSIPEIDANPNRLSFTELEYRYARERQARGELIILTFLMHDDHLRTKEQFEQDAEKIIKLNAFRTEVADASNKGVSAFFTSPDTLYAEVLDALHKLARKMGTPIQAPPDDVIEHYLNKTLPDSILEVGSIANLGLLDKTFIELSADVRQQTAPQDDNEQGILDDPDLDIGGDFVFDFAIEDAPAMDLHGAIYAPHESEYYGEPEYTPDIRERMRTLKRVVLLGVPGAGKTFTLARLALDYRNAYRDDSEALIPIFVPLSSYRTAQDFEAFLDSRLGGLPFRDLRIVWLLDALNEMPREYGQLGQVKTFIKHLVETDAPFVLTCRVRNYDEELRDVPDLHRIDLQDLNPRQLFDILTHFIGRDYAEQVWAGVMYGVYTNYTGEKINLLDAWEAWDGSVRDFWERPSWCRNEYERGRQHIYRDPRKLMLLCRNPFTLVRLLIPRIRAAAQTAKQTGHELSALLEQALPNNRAQLFGHVIDGMLKAEAERKAWTNADRTTLQTALEFTATALQASEQRTEITLTELLNAENAPANLRERLKMGRDAGLITLTETAVRFNHQLYQEYFATKKLRDLLADYSHRHPDWETGDALPPRDEGLAELFPRWWDVEGWPVTVALLGELEGRTGIQRVVRWLASYTPSIALEALIEQNNDGLTIDDLSDVAKKALIDGANQRKDESNPIGRATTYRVLGLLNADTRSGIGVVEVQIPLPLGEGFRIKALPDIDWVTIPAGEFSYQDGTMTLDYDFQIARYPLTYAQFQTFLDDPEGYPDKERWFEGLHEDAKKVEMAEQKFKYSNHPRERVNWYQAIAFCRWFSWRLGGDYALDAIDQWAVRLPTEFEWEKAARANTGWAYPYGNEFDASKGNTFETGIRQTSAVGIFSSGDTPHWDKPIGDLNGNVWEWCLTDYDNPQIRTVDENISYSDSRRVLRGGSWHHDTTDNFRCDYRNGNNPLNWGNSYGFRLFRFN